MDSYFWAVSDTGANTITTSHSIKINKYLVKMICQSIPRLGLK